MATGRLALTQAARQHVLMGVAVAAEKSASAQNLATQRLVSGALPELDATVDALDPQALLFKGLMNDPSAHLAL